MKFGPVIPPKHETARPLCLLSATFFLQLEDTIHLQSNPLHWSVNKTIEFIKTTDCAHLARLFKEQVSSDELMEHSSQF